jgi:transketolase
VAVEAGVSACWARLVGDRGKVIGIDRFGASAPAEALFEHYGLTSANVSRAVRESLAAAEQSDH